MVSPLLSLEKKELMNVEIVGPQDTLTKTTLAVGDSFLKKHTLKLSRHTELYQQMVAV